MAEPELVHILMQGVKAWNDWRSRQDEDSIDYNEPNLSRQPLGSLDLSGANFRRVVLNRTDFIDATLVGADIRESMLIGADLARANLSGAKLGKSLLREASLSFAKLRGANLNGADLTGADLTGADLTGATLRHTSLPGADLTGTILRGADLAGADLDSARLIKTDLEGANMSGCRVYGVSAWNVRLRDTTQTNLIITPRHEPTLEVDSLEVAQFIYLLINNRKVREFIDTVTGKAVLLLGRFTPDRKAVLDRVREALRRENYLPIMFDFEGPQNRDLQETISTLARLARFIIADITDPKSIPQELISIVPELPSVPVQPLLQRGHEPWAMFGAVARYPWVLPLHRYEEAEDLLASLAEKVIAPAEAKAEEQRRQREGIEQKLAQASDP